MNFSFVAFGSQKSFRDGSRFQWAARPQITEECGYFGAGKKGLAFLDSLELLNFWFVSTSASDGCCCSPAASAPGPTAGGMIPHLLSDGRAAKFLHSSDSGAVPENVVKT